MGEARQFDPRNPRYGLRSAGFDAHDVDLDAAPKCPQCGYVLLGMSRMRCPECGVPLDAADINPTQARLAANEQYRDERKWRKIGAGLWAAGLLLLAWPTWVLRPVSICIVGPLIGSTLLALVWYFIGNTALHRLMMIVGVAWSAAGVLTMMLWLLG
jgi:hypothetical protein